MAAVSAETGVFMGLRAKAIKEAHAQSVHHISVLKAHLHMPRVAPDHARGVPRNTSRPRCNVGASVSDREKLQL